MSPMSARFPIAGLRTVGLLVPDLEKAVRFYTGIWGLFEAHREDGTVYLRGTGTDSHILTLRRADRMAVEAITFRADPASDLEDLRHRLTGAGATAVGEVMGRPELGGGIGFEARDLRGRRLIVIQNDTLVPEIAGAGSRPRRLAHVNINCPDISAEIAFYERGMGFALTDRSKAMGFLRTNDDHHAVVLASDTVDTLNHIAFLHDTWEDVMRAGGRMCDAGYPIGWGPGRHGPGDNVFLYFVDPFGVVVEHTAEVLKVDDNYKIGGPADWTWPEGRSDQWGIAAPKTDACKKAQLSIPFA